tara:strand:+ start:63746 stop:64087 length:342 start_codon:yes stop_codon:yes gene_type:complete
MSDTAITEALGLKGMMGYDTFCPEPWTEEVMLCRVCGLDCDVMRDVVGPTSFGGAMAKKARKHDLFTCAYRGKAWHEQALRLVKGIEDCPSPTLKRIMQGDLQQIIESQEVME